MKVLCERLWAALLPAPDTLLSCGGAPDVIWARKQECPTDVFLRARERYLRLVDEFPGEQHLLAKAQVLEVLRGTAANGRVTRW